METTLVGMKLMAAKQQPCILQVSAAAHSQQMPHHLHLRTHEENASVPCSVDGPRPCAEEMGRNSAECQRVIATTSTMRPMQDRSVDAQTTEPTSRADDRAYCAVDSSA